MPNLTCLICETPVFRKGGPGRNPKFCSLECRNLGARLLAQSKNRSRHIVIEKQCVGCGLMFLPQKTSKQTFCSKGCQRKSNRQTSKLYYQKNREKINAQANRRNAIKRLGKPKVSKTCKMCQAVFFPDKSMMQGYCSDFCRSAAWRDSSSKTCTETDCDRPLRAKGLCILHYNRKVAPERRYKKYEMPCTICGVLCEKYKSGDRAVVCSDRCRAFLQYGTWPKSKELVYAGSFPVTWLPARHPVIRIVEGGVDRPARRFVSGPCSWCGEEFTAVTTNVASYCSKRCMAKSGRSKRSDKHGAFSISERRRSALYVRDLWVCQLCFEPVERNAYYLDNWAPSLDHIVPQSKQAVPDHSDANLRTAHRWCNSIRSDGTYTDINVFFDSFRIAS